MDLQDTILRYNNNSVLIILRTDNISQLCSVSKNYPLPCMSQFVSLRADNISQLFIVAKTVHVLFMSKSFSVERVVEPTLAMSLNSIAFEKEQTTL